MKQVLLFVCCLLLTACADRDADQRDERTDLERAKPIVEAITKYRMSNGRLPISLAELVPDYLNAIPVTSRGTGYNYQRMKRPEEYELSFQDANSSYYGCTYMSRFAGAPDDNEWDCTDGHR